MTAEAFKDILASLGTGLYRIAYRFLEDEAEAKDAVQDLLVKLWNSRDSLDKVSNIQAYAFTLMKNLCIDRIRKKKHSVNCDPPEKAGAPPESAMDEREELRRALKLIEELPPKQRDILKMRVFEEMEYDEIAEKMGLTQINTRVQLSLARKTLKQKLQEYERI